MLWPLRSSANLGDCLFLTDLSTVREPGRARLLPSHVVICGKAARPQPRPTEDRRFLSRARCCRPVFHGKRDPRMGGERPGVAIGNQRVREAVVAGTSRAASKLPRPCSNARTSLMAAASESTDALAREGSFDVSHVSKCFRVQHPQGTDHASARRPPEFDRCLHSAGRGARLRMRRPARRRCRLQRGVGRPSAT